MAFPGGPGMMPASMNPNAGMSEQEQQMVKAMQMGMESCLGKTVMAGVMGGGLGAMFGLFMSSMRYDTPMSQPLPVNTPTPTPAPKGPATSAVASAAANAKSTLNAAAAAPSPSVVLNPTGGGATIPITDLPMRQQLRAGLRDMYQSSKSSGKNFAKVGAIFSGTECAIEGLRAKNDLYNGVAGGCLTGGILARNAGPQAVAVGCAGFAVFSAAIDAYMRMPEDERSRPIA
ncbi:mitochondrial import inner membrane translocase subunit TIM22 [Parastagonospora nodorum]|nr:mitochondrial import inner membrane translocase subunit TIM22 [Parastagonospora nodorum]KAH3998634.1 mitochondrial import inner membrane translocase subunit TIM22 [Parastagonospora nodorum]KAH4024271.1 mitochondrial import inner membrane translocase subunit TIM22 [Parastagonospora nodorum]KAH4033994.1 mitochondrial import inner membrane translocase subunit TIM22 [Parastagonospora nodorum]KAH4104370.1 mitochondrial import inner membrane translocase subunit TIM22 [Parastagonospora nodorum]